MNIAIIGAGLIGRKRAQALPKGINLSLVCDIDEKKAFEFARDFKCEIVSDWKKVVKDKNIEAIIISTTNNWLSPIAEAAIISGKHVLIEKPGARNFNELQRVVKAYQKRKVVINFGFNHRYHPAIMKAKDIISSKKFGDVLFIRAKYGHGGRLGYEKEWRFNKDIAGGGELLDQGVHLIDLVNYFYGRMQLHSSLVDNLFWNTTLDDSAFLILKDKKKIASLSVSCVEWKNIFVFELMLKTAKIQIDGLGRSYGQERLTLYTMSPKMGPPKKSEFGFKEEDLSWKRENQVFFQKIKQKNYSDEGLKDANYVLKLIDQVYKKNKSHR